MGLGQQKREADSKAVEECLNPLGNKDPEKAAVIHKKGTWQKLQSTKVPLIHFLLIVGSLILVIIIAIAVLSKKGEIPTRATENATLYSGCMNDWIQYKRTCYYFSDKLDTWTNSENFCQSQNSSLANIDSIQELGFLNRFKGESNHWIGLIRLENDSGWVWTNGTPYSETIFKIQRGAKDPDECVFLNHQGIKSSPGRYLKKWICYKKLILQTIKVNVVH